MVTKHAFVSLTAAFILAAICLNKIHAQAAPTDSLAMYRLQIDSLDKQLIEVLGKRMNVVEAVGHYKAAHNIAALQKARFDAILQKNIQMGKSYNLSAELITAVMNAIHKESLAKEAATAGKPTGN